MKLAATLLAALVALATVDSHYLPELSDGRLQKDVRSNSQLTEDLQEFFLFLNTEEILNVIMDYAINDPEVQKATLYAYSNEFHEMVRAVEALKEYQSLVLYLNDAGLDIFVIIQQFHDMIGMEDYVPPKPTTLDEKLRSTSQTSEQKLGGIKGMVEEIKALLPRKEIKDLYEKKMRTSKAFADFIAHLRSPDMQKIVNAVYTHEVFLEMREKALAVGLDLEAAADLFRTLFGLEFPKPMY